MTVKERMKVEELLLKKDREIRRLKKKIRELEKLRGFEKPKRQSYQGVGYNAMQSK